MARAPGFHPEDEGSIPFYGSIPVRYRALSVVA